MEGKQLLLAAASRGVWKPVELHLKKKLRCEKRNRNPAGRAATGASCVEWVWVENMWGGETRRSAVNTRRKEGPLPRIGWSGTRRTGAELAGSSAGDMPTTTEGRQPDGSRAGDGRTPGGSGAV